MEISRDTTFEQWFADWKARQPPRWQLDWADFDDLAITSALRAAWDAGNIRGADTAIGNRMRLDSMAG